MEVPGLPTMITHTAWRIRISTHSGTSPHFSHPSAARRPNPCLAASDCAICPRRIHQYVSGRAPRRSRGRFVFLARQALTTARRPKLRFGARVCEKCGLAGAACHLRDWHRLICGGTGRSCAGACRMWQLQTTLNSKLICSSTRSGGSGSRSFLLCPFCPPRLAFFPFPAALCFLGGGFTMSLEGDLDELEESFNAFASFNSSSSIRFACAAICFACASTILRNSAIMSSLLAIRGQ